MEAIILAGGFGRRLMPCLSGTPKSMAPIRSRPFLEYLFDYLICEGIEAVTVALGYGAEAITDHFKGQYRRLMIQYSIESEPLGTGGALKQALLLTASDRIFVVNGDTFAQVDYREMAREYEQGTTPMTMAVTYLNDISRYGKVNILSGVVRSIGAGRQGESGYVNAGVYLIPRNLLEHVAVSRRFSFERDFLEVEIATLQPRAFVIQGYFIDIGVPADYERANIELPELE
ncbi:MAG: NTP transferase domain-containing protein [Nitrospira sp.]|nr:NTP transferase domain-containing protein [Nitrospira sp.]